MPVETYPARSPHHTSVCTAYAIAPSALRVRSRRRLAARAVASAALALAFAGPTVAAESPDACALRNLQPADRIVHVPFDTVDGRIYVQAHVNGHGPFRFAVDTGASGQARADATLVATLGLQVGGETTTSDGVQSAQVQTTHLQSLELGGLTRNDVDAITRDYASRAAPDAKFAGIIAREFFADGLLVIDFPARVLTFSRSAGLSPGMRNALPYERAFRIPVVIGDVRVIGNLDTGANVAFVLPQSLYAQVAAATPTAAGLGRLTNGAIEAGRATVRGPFRVGTVSLSDVDVRVSERYPELLVGAHALQDAVVLIDQRSKQVAVCERASPP